MEMDSHCVDYYCCIIRIQQVVRRESNTKHESQSITCQRVRVSRLCIPKDAKAVPIFGKIDLNSKILLVGSDQTKRDEQIIV